MQISKFFTKNIFIPFGKINKINKISFNKNSSFGFLNVLTKSNNQETEVERYAKLKSKFSPKKNEEEEEEKSYENFENIQKNVNDQSFLKFLEFMKYKETFTWQNNLELMKVNFLNFFLLNFLLLNF